VTGRIARTIPPRQALPDPSREHGRMKWRARLLKPRSSPRRR
jgi:hypothetical protein